MGGGIRIVLPIKDEYILYYGHFTKEKGVKTLIEVCKRLPNVKFVFAGTGPLEDLLNEVENIENVGFQTGDKLRKLVSCALFCIVPSEWYENCPFTVMESLMYGVPVLGASIGGIPELIDVDKTGLLFNPGDLEDMLRKITYLLNHKNQIYKYALNCKKVLFDDVECYCEKLLKIYIN